jgi:hypothetical protein
MTLADPDAYLASYDSSERLYTVKNTTTGQTVQMTEESFNEFINKMDTTIQDLDTFRAQLLSGSTVVTRPYSEDYPQAGYYQAQIDTLNPKFGTFDDAIELQEAYRTVFYPSRTEQLDRVFHGLNTGRVISEDIKNSYLESDGNVSADVVNIQNEFDSKGGTISASDVEEAREENESGRDMPATGNETGGNGSGGNESGGEEPPPML